LLDLNLISAGAFERSIVSFGLELEFTVGRTLHTTMQRTMIKTLLLLASIGLGQATRLSDKATAELREACPEYGEYSKYPQ
jgi:hypothetical protein